MDFSELATIRTTMASIFRGTVSRVCVVHAATSAKRSVGCANQICVSITSNISSPLGQHCPTTSTIHEITHQLIPTTLTLRGIEPYLLVADKCSRALLGLEHAANFKFAIRANYRIRIDGKIDSQLPYGGELITRGERASGDASGN